jgi:transposase-like protein
MWPAAWHHAVRYANNRVEADHAQLKRQLPPFVQNLRRGHYEIAADQPRNLRLAIAFGQLATAI